MTEGEMAEFMSTLLGNADLGGSAETGTYDASNAGDFLRAHLPENITADNFAAQVLGFLTDGETTANNDWNCFVQVISDSRRHYRKMHLIYFS